MRKRRLIWQLYPSFLLITVLAIVIISWFTTHEIRQFYIKRTASDLEARARIFKNNITRDVLNLNPDQIDRMCKEIGSESSTRITVVLPDGSVVGDAEESPGQMDNHNSRPEIRQALLTGSGMSIRRSSTLKKEMMYYAISVRESGDCIAVVRMSIPLTSINDVLQIFSNRIIVAGLIIIAIAAIVVYWVSRKISLPIEELKAGAERFAKGDLKRIFPVTSTEEISLLADAMNKMAGQLESRIKALVEERNEKEAILSSLIEGVLAVDNEEKIIHMNQATARMLDTQPEISEGMLIHEVVRNTEIQQLVSDSFEKKETLERDILFHGENERSVHVVTTPLLDGKGEQIGILIIFNDVTQIRKLEEIRRDFVANVSHEIRTPITSIKGFVEVLLDGAIDDDSKAKHFLGIVLKQSDNLNAIVEDLLHLSKIERDTEADEIYFQAGDIKSVLRSAIENCDINASKKKIAINLEIENTPETRINAQLLEQAVVNLINNAIKYSEEGSEITVAAKYVDETIHINVIDSGCGIASEHLPRLFERFYRVDKARSRELGGTGLGLAIVKHISQAHGGSVSVESEPGSGSEFSIHLPLREISSDD